MEEEVAMVATSVGRVATGQGSVRKGGVEEEVVVVVVEAVAVAISVGRWATSLGIAHRGELGGRVGSGEKGD